MRDADVLMQTATPWSNEEVRTLRTLWADGESTEEIARVLGRTSGSVRGAVQRHRLGRSGGPDLRPCLTCQRPFQPEGRFVRICRECKMKPEWQSGNDCCDLSGL